LLGADSKNVELVAIVANPVYRSPAYTVAFDQQEGLENVANWLYLTGSVTALSHVWSSFGVQVAYSPAGAMIAHSDIAYIINKAGYTRDVLDMDPGPGTETTQSSSAVLLTNTIRSVLGS
jgi:cytochrome oxidase Cu insertion factor (SCO1/SenC/PrrC family)